MRLSNSGVTDSDLIEASKLLEYLRVRGKEIVTLQEIYQYGPNSIRDSKKARKLMTILVDHGYALPSTNDVSVGGKNRKETHEVRYGNP